MSRSKSTRTVAVTLENFALTVDASTVPSGHVTFDLSFSGEHNFAVHRTDFPAEALPTNQNGAVDPLAEGLEVIGFTPSHSNERRPLTLDLAPGRYVLVCNVVNHYSLGMGTSLEVTD